MVHNSSAFEMLGGAPLTGFAPSPDVEIVDVALGRPAMFGTYISSRPVGYSARLTAAIADSDIVHFHNPSLLGGIGASQLPSGLRIYTTHEHWLLCPMHTLFRNEREVCTRRTCTTCCAVYGRPPQPWRWTGHLDRSVGALDAIMSPSRFTAELHRQRFPNASIEVVRPPGPRIRATVLADETVLHSTQHDRPFVLFAGRLQPIKGALWLAEELRAQSDLDVVFVGDGPERAAIEQLAQGSSRITVLGQRSHAEVLQLCSAARALIVPSLGYETFGGAGREALSVGTPVVVRALGPLPELVENGGGVCFENAEELRAIIARIAHDSDWYQSLRASVPNDDGGADDGEADEARFFRDYFSVIEAAANRRGLEALATWSRSLQ